MYGVEPGSGLAIVLDRLTRPYAPDRVTAALLGVPTRVARQLVGAVLASSDEAEHLLHSMPTIVRSLAIATTDQPERCVGEIRGPVLWGETMSARSASAGDPGLFVCATTTKAYDTDENRVLTAALAAVRRAGRHVEQGMAGFPEEMVRRARQNGHTASRFLDHQTLMQVPVVRPTGRALRRTRAGSRRHTYQPALQVLRRAGEPVQAAHLAAFSDDRTTAQHDLFAATLQHLEAVTGRRPDLRTDHGGLSAGNVTYHHPGRTGEAGHVDGVAVGDVLLDVPDPLDGDLASARAALQARAGARQALLAVSVDDVEAAVSRGLR